MAKIEDLALGEHVRVCGALGDSLNTFLNAPHFAYVQSIDVPSNKVFVILSKTEPKLGGWVHAWQVRKTKKPKEFWWVSEGFSLTKGEPVEAIGRMYTCDPEIPAQIHLREVRRKK